MLVYQRVHVIHYVSSMHLLKPDKWTAIDTLLLGVKGKRIYEMRLLVDMANHGNDVEFPGGQSVFQVHRSWVS
jgi:hypothetical protein